MNDPLIRKDSDESTHIHTHILQPNERQKNISSFCNNHIFNDLADLTSDYDYYIEGKSQILEKEDVTIVCIRRLPDGRIIYGTSNEELKILNKSPYFVRCDLVYEDSDEIITRYFAKFQFTEESIYSWVAPISSIRFEKPGEITYKLPSGEKKKAKLIRKDQYMIVDGKVMFFTQELIDSSRELIFQEYFSNRKTGFVLPEIVSQMEKAQDQIIRAHHKGSLVISGPAGSGKTTLALHRTAYLMQSPDTTGIFTDTSVIVFVQDNRTKDYFSHLLPELGINGVRITTFYEWAMEILGLEEYSYITRYGNADEEKDIYEYEKLKTLKSKSIPPFNSNPYIILNNVYSKNFSERNFTIFKKQKEEKKLDRFDLTIILMSYIQKYKVLKRKNKKYTINYSLVLIDEFQNYLPEQLSIIKQCLNKDNGSAIYIGDIAQRTNLGTISDFKEIEEIVPDERKVELKKVYRNTKKILDYIKGLGYKVSIPEGVTEGIDVLEKIGLTIDEQISHIKNISENNKNKTIGILAKSREDLEKFETEFKDNKNIHILSIIESQGVEFDIVFMVGISQKTFSIKHIDESIEHTNERKKIYKDLLYVGLTRAISELYVFGEEKLSTLISDIINF